MKTKVTITDVAKHCNVSKSSVSRYLNQGYVSKENAEKIQKAIDELGFETNYFARRLKAKHSHLVGVLVPDLSAYETSRIVNGMQRKFDEHKYQGIIVLTENNVDKEIACIKSLTQQGVDGIIIVHSEHIEALQEVIEQSGVLVLYANQMCTYAPFLDIDEYQAGKLMGEYFCTRHFHKVAYLHSDNAKTKKRMDSFLKVYKEKNILCTVETIPCDTTLEQIERAAHTILDKQFDAVLCEQDMFAVGILKYFHEFHIHVPQNLSLASFGGHQICTLTSPQITTLSYGFEAFGENLVEEVIAICEERAPNWQEVTLTLQEGGSVKGTTIS